MKAAHMKQKIVIPALVGMMMIPGSAVYAADQKAEVYPVLPAAGIETVVTDCYETKVKENLQLYLVPTGEGEYLNMAFSNTGEEFTYIRSAPDENSDWIGKLYPDSAVRVLEYKEDWVKIQSGDAQGFVPADTLYLGEDAKSHAGEYEKEVATVTADVLNVRAGQGVETQVLTQIMQNQEYEITGEPKMDGIRCRQGRRRLGIRGVYQYRDNVFLRRDERSRRGEEARADYSAGNTEGSGSFRPEYCAESGCLGTGCHRLRLSVYWKSVRMGRYQSDRRSGLLWICTVCVCTFRD